MLSTAQRGGDHCPREMVVGTDAIALTPAHNASFSLLASEDFTGVGGDLPALRPPVPSPDLDVTATAGTTFPPLNRNMFVGFWGREGA